MDCLLEERVAIMIYDGGLSEAAAKDKAWHCCYRRMEMKTNRDGGVEFKHSLVVPGAIKAAVKELAKQEESLGQMSFEEFRAQARSRFNYE